MKCILFVCYIPCVDIHEYALLDICFSLSRGTPDVGAERPS